MQAPPLVRGSVVIRSASLLLGLFFFALGIVLLLESGLGFLGDGDVVTMRGRAGIGADRIELAEVTGEVVG